MSIDLGNLLQSQLGSVLGQFLTNSGEAEESSGKAAGLAMLPGLRIRLPA